jgi:AraC-like DNA-binding protein/ligand-binding sensor protein
MQVAIIPAPHFLPRPRILPSWRHNPNPDAMNRQDFDSAEARAIRTLGDSSLFRTWCKAFRMATGLEVELVPVEEPDAGPAPDSRSANAFCARLGQDGGCRSCSLSNLTLREHAAERPATHLCFAGMRESAVPVRVGDHALAHLLVGQVFDHEPDAESFSAVALRLRQEGMAASRVAALREAYLQAPVMPAERYQGALTLLAAFALQLGEELNRLLIAEQNAESPTVTRARQYINAHLDEKITLDAVAAHVCVSPFYFCKIFKQATGMTLTEYVNRRRIEWAKRKLLNPQARVTEVAYDVGYQSLSQFNRSFLRYAGESPTKFREQAHAEHVLEAA